MFFKLYIVYWDHILPITLLVFFQILTVLCLRNEKSNKWRWGYVWTYFAKGSVVVGVMNASHSLGNLNTFPPGVGIAWGGWVVQTWWGSTLLGESFEKKNDKASLTSRALYLLCACSIKCELSACCSRHCACWFLSGFSAVRYSNLQEL